MPLTTYTFSTGVLDSAGTVSASDEERLPSGSFSLRHGFPQWYARARRTSSTSQRCSINKSNGLSSSATSSSGVIADTKEDNISIEETGSSGTNIIIEVLQYMKFAFEDATLLDNLPLEAAGNPSAWYAWRAHRGLPKAQSKIGINPASFRQSSPARHPGDWNWEGVWESRVVDGIEASTSEAALFGSKGNPYAQTEAVSLELRKRLMQ